MNSGNNTVFGHGSYDNSEGSVLYRGNSIELRSKGVINVTSPTAGLSDRAFGINKVLWSGVMYMTQSQTATLSEKISAQPNGVVLMWSFYDGTARDYGWNFTFVPKYFISKHSGCGVSALLIAGGFAYPADKYVYVSDNKIMGNDNNDDGATTSYGVTHYSNMYVLRYVIGV